MLFSGSLCFGILHPTTLKYHKKAVSLLFTHGSFTKKEMRGKDVKAK